MVLFLVALSYLAIQFYFLNKDSSFNCMLNWLGSYKSKAPLPLVLCNIQGKCKTKKFSLKLALRGGNPATDRYLHCDVECRARLFHNFRRSRGKEKDQERVEEFVHARMCTR